MKVKVLLVETTKAAQLIYFGYMEMRTDNILLKKKKLNECQKNGGKVEDQN